MPGKRTSRKPPTWDEQQEQARQLEEERRRRDEEQREARRQEREARQAMLAAHPPTVDSDLDPLDAQVQASHRHGKAAKYQNHSTSAMAMPFFDSSGWGQSSVVQQRPAKATTHGLDTFADEHGHPAPKHLGPTASGEHADPLAVLSAFTSHLDDDGEGELPLFMQFGVSQGRCDPCDDFLDDFPIVMDPDRRLYEDTKKWVGPPRMDAPSDDDEGW